MKPGRGRRAAWVSLVLAVLAAATVAHLQRKEIAREAQRLYWRWTRARSFERGSAASRNKALVAKKIPVRPADVF